MIISIRLEYLKLLTMGKLLVLDTNIWYYITVNYLYSE